MSASCRRDEKWREEAKPAAVIWIHNRTLNLERCLLLIIFSNIVLTWKKEITFLFSESIRWPAGLYGIPKAASGCPKSDDFQWLIGRRYQDTENYKPASKSSNKLHLDATVSSNDIERSFCMKTSASSDMERTLWPRGSAVTYLYSIIAIR